ncbi:MAG: hypothetical protein ACRCTP_03955 [Aeromonas popoffii]|uniref:hypothetical protein n=1 Tax=Aeromonas popoffii TaxID=70856 RepID=UPI003F2E7145
MAGNTQFKVQGQPNLVRRSNSPAVLVNTNSEGFKTFRGAKAKAQESIDLRDEVEILRNLVADFISKKEEGQL